MKRLLAELRRARRPKRPGRSRRGVALVMVLGALTLLTVMLTELQGESSAELGSALSERDGLKAEYAARSAVNLSRLLIAAEPTIRAAIAPLFLLQRQGPPQIPVWEFADQVLGAFNDAAGSERFTALSSVNLAEGRNLGLEGAGFEVTVVDEDSKINFNLPARGDAFSQARLAAQVMGLIGGLQYTPMFERRDADGSFSDRQAVCSAIIDWTDPDQDEYRCDTDSATAQ
ncbi:MAG TPA: type II secretion system protein GspK, partial [Polyangiaceae bacterium]